MRILLDFMLEVIKIVAAFLGSLYKDEPLTIEIDEQKRKILIPKSIILVGFTCLTVAMLAFLN